MSRLKKIIVLLCVMSFSVVLIGCTADASAGEKDSAEEDALLAPELSQVQGICELATLECYYHNVAKSVKEPGTGLVHFGEKERPFWIEYTGTAEISFRSDLIEMEQRGKEIIITLPPPEITCSVDPDSWNEDSYIISKDQWIQKNPITAEDQTLAIEAAQADMQEMVKTNPLILKNARAQAEDLVENYIEQVSRAAGVDYHVSWNDENLKDAKEPFSLAEEPGEDGGR